MLDKLNKQFPNSIIRFTWMNTSFFSAKFYFTILNIASCFLSEVCYTLNAMKNSQNGSAIISGLCTTCRSGVNSGVTIKKHCNPQRKNLIQCNVCDNIIYEIPYPERILFNYYNKVFYCILFSTDFGQFNRQWNSSWIIREGFAWCSTVTAAILTVQVKMWFSISIKWESLCKRS